MLLGSLALAPPVLALLAVSRCYLQTLQLCSFVLGASAAVGKGVSGNTWQSYCHATK